MVSSAEMEVLQCVLLMHLKDISYYGETIVVPCSAAGQLVMVVGLVGTYNVSVKELKSILSYLYTTAVWVSQCVGEL